MLERELGWQFQHNTVPLLLQDIDWREGENDNGGLGDENSIILPPEVWDTDAPEWLPPRYNATALLVVYRQRVGLGKWASVAIAM